jgi:hypothetical protein
MAECPLQYQVINMLAKAPDGIPQLMEFAMGTNCSAETASYIVRSIGRAADKNATPALRHIASIAQDGGVRMAAIGVLLEIDALSPLELRVLYEQPENLSQRCMILSTLNDKGVKLRRKNGHS